MRRFLQLSLLGLALFFVSNASFAQSITASTATLAALATTYGTVSSEVSFTFTATGLGATEQVNIAAPSGFEVSLTTGTGFTTLVFVNATGGNIASTSIFVRLKATTTPGSYSGNVALVGTTASANVATTSSTVNTKTLTITGATASNKQYDGALTASLGGTPVLSGVLPADVANVTLNIGAATGAFNTKNVGTGKTVTTTGYAITGTASSYYTLTQPTTTADITAKNLTITGVTANNKTFDNNTTATLAGTATLNGIISPDVVTISGTPVAVFANVGPAIGISVTVTGYTLAGADFGNYTVSQPTGLTATITSALPTTQPSGMTFTNITNTALRVNYSAAGNGSARILIAKSGSAVSVNPVNGTTYTANGNFSTGTDLGSGNIVVGIITSTTAGFFDITNLTANTTYHFALYEFNGSAGLESYNTTAPLTGSQTVRNEPANHVTGFTSSATASVITLNWTGSIGSPAPTNYLVLARDITNGGAYVAFSDGTASPTDDTNLSSQTSTWQGAQNINFGTNTFNGWSNLTSGNQYEFVIYPYTTGGSLSPDFKTDGSIPTTTVFTEPSASASNPTFSNIAAASIDVTVGGGTGISGGYLVIRKSGSAPTATPVDGTSYTPGNTIAAGETIVYTGAAGLFTDSGLSPVTTYYYVVYGYSGSGVNTNYRISSPGSANSTTICSPPTVQTSNLTFSGVVDDQMTVNWTRGNGNNVIVFARDGASATADPVNGTPYTANSVFGSGTAIAISGNDYFAVYSGTGTSVTVTGLSASTSYNFHVFEYNTTGLCYLTSIAPANVSQTTTASGINGSITTVSAAATISSIANTSGSKVAAFTFKVTDDNADNSATRLSSLIFRPGVGNNITNFSDLLLGADLTDQYGNIQTANITIGTNTITITGITSSGPSTTSLNTLGRTDDGDNKNYNLNVWLKTTFAGSISPATVDGLKLVFSLAANDITYNTSGVTSSRILAGSSCEAGSTNGVITVVATKININQQPATSAVASIALSTQPIFEATDANNNRDLNINNAITVTTSNAINLGAASAPAAFVNGLVDFTGSGFNFPNAGTSTMAVTITAPNITSPNSNSITVTASTTLGSSIAALASTPLINSSTGNAVLGFSLQTSGSTLNLTDLAFTSNVSATGLVNNFKLFSNTSDSFIGATQVATSTTQTFSGLTIPVNGTIKYFYLVCDVDPYFPTISPQIQFSLSTANITVSTGSKTGLTQTGPLYNLVDQTPPTVTSIDISSATEPWSTVNGSSASTLTWLATFSEPVTGIDATDFNLIDPSVTGITYTLPLVVTGSGNTRTITLNNVKLISAGANRQLYIDLVDDNTIIDNVGYTLGGPALGDGNLNSTVAFPGSSASGFNDYYTVLFKEPSNAASGLTISRTTTSLTVGWINPVLPLNPASYYFIQVKKSTTPSFPALNDGTYLTNLDTDATDGSYASLYSATATSAIISNLPSGLNYDVRITALSYSGYVNLQYLMDYLNSSTLNGSDFTTTAANGTLSGSGSAAISSLIDTPAESQSVFTFNVLDDGATPTSDNAPLKFSQLVVSPGTGNTVANWTTAIAGAELTNGATTIAGTVNAGNITFSSLNAIPAQATDLGYVADDQNKPYQLKIWLNTTVTDNSKLAFRVNNASFTYDNTLDATNFSKVSSQLAAGQLAESGAVNINVTATKLAFTTQPPTAIGVATPFSSMGTPPVVKATDANNNLDTDYTATFNVTPSTGVVTSLTNFTGGILTLNSFSFSTAGSRTITITGNSTGAPFNYTALSGPGVEALSTSVNAVISNKTTIAEATAPSSELASFSSITNTLPASFNFDFTITDDVGADATTFTDNDGLPTLIQTLTITQGANNGTNQSPGPNDDATTFDDWTKSIAGAQLSDGVSTITISPGANITGSSLIFSIPALSSLRTVADGAAKTYQLRIWLKNPVDPTLQDILDNKDFSFAINQGNIVVDPTANITSTLATSSASTGDGRNVVTVTATQLDFITQWATNAAQSYDAPLSPNPTAKARDANNNLDINFNAAVSVSAFDVDGIGPKTYPLSNSTVTVNNGNLSFNANLQVSSSGNGSNNDVSRLILTSTGLTSGNSNNFVLGYSASSDIIKDSGLTYPTDILYSSTANQVTNITTNNGTTGTVIERFKVRDGGGTTDADGTDTKLSSITFRITNYQYLRKLALYDGTTELSEVDVALSAINSTGTTLGSTAEVTLTGFTFSAPDANPREKSFDVVASFNATNVIDNAVVSFQVMAVATSGASSSFANAAPTAITSTVTSNQNKIEVVASQLHFTTPATASFASLSSPFAVTVQARDVNANLDLDFNATITALTNATSATMSSTPAVVGSSFTSGVYIFPSDFMYTSGINNDDVTLSISAGGINSVPVSPGPAPYTPIITLRSSSESAIVGDPTFTFTTNIPYEIYPEAIDLTDANSFELARALLVDGSRSAFAYTSTFGSAVLTTNTETDGLANQDLDGAPTQLNSLTIRVTNPANIRRIALFTNGGTQIGAEISVNEAKSVTSKDFVFSGSPLLSAADNSISEIRVRVSFWNDPAHITDNQLIQVSVVDAILGTGSKFYPPITNPAYIAGVSGGLSAPSSVNFIEVTATSLDIVTQPSGYAGINEPIDGSLGASPGGNTGIVHARDKFAVIDLDFNFIASVSATANPTLVSTNFASGILDLTGMKYANSGLGTLTVVANGLSSNNLPWATSAKSNVVDVIHVTALPPQNPNNGMITSPSLKGGTSNIVIFGFDIFPTYSTSAEPELKGFSIIFDEKFKTAGTTIFKNLKVFESLVGTYAGSTNVSTIVGTTIVEGQSPTLVGLGAPVTSKDMLTVTFPVGSYRSLKNRNQSTPITYFLVVDVDATANLSTPKITPQLLDGGFYSPDNNSIITTIGSSTANVKGTTFGFASTRPPTLLSSVPANGALNVDPLLSTVQLTFDVGVWSHDQTILLYERWSNQLIDKLTAVNGQYPGPVAGSTSNPTPLTFSIPNPGKFIPDSVYYITIAKGTFDPNTKQGTGISDDGFNLYGGISYNGGLYFKIASKNPPVMVSSDPNKYYESATGATVNASFDQKEGTAYYMVVNQGDPAPTNAMIKGTDLTYTGIVQARGQFIINQVTPNLNSAIFNVAPSGISRTFDVWMYAENGAPIPVATTAPYGKFIADAITTNDYIPGAAGPTFSLTIPAANANVYLNKPVYQICANSTVTLIDPIIIEESTARNEFSGGTQNFNLLLPSGFTFDIGATPLLQTSGGADFTGGFSYSYLNSTILKITFTNTGNVSQDKIIISNLRVKANASDLAGSIIRFAGNAFPLAPATLGDGTVLAGIASSTATSLDFNNSFTLANNFSASPIFITNPVTAIPDNYIDPDKNLGPYAVRLSPIVPKGDYGPSTFSGNGVTNDVLSLSGVPLNTAFDITMTHVDMNGCISNEVEQYEVYDHTRAIPALVDNTYGTKDYISNPNYLLNQSPPAFSNIADSVGRYFKAGYNMVELFANIPARATALDSVNVSLNTTTSQIMYGPAWQSLVKQIPIKKDSSAFNIALGEYYRSYYWYYGVLMPLGSTLDPYKYFDDFTPEKRKFFRGGSLGLVEFTGKFRSTADATVLIPIRQEIEVFVPAIPVVEINSNTISGYDITDPLRPNPATWPLGTPIFCQNGSDITINGFPAVTSGVSAGHFDIIDAANPSDTLYSYTTPSKRYGGFVDNGNGTAIITPSLLKNSLGQVANNYKDIRIVYTFKNNASPIAGSGDLVIRITPNPVADFSTSMLCEDIDVVFTDTSTLPAGSGASIARAIWNYSDNKSSAALNADTILYPSVKIPIHKYSDPGSYPNVSLSVTTNYGCANITPAIKTLSVGGTPQVAFSFLGVSTADPIAFVNESTVANDVIAQLDWTFGDGNTKTVTSNFGLPSINNYTNAGPYTANLKVTSLIGCNANRSKPVIILPRAVPTSASPYLANFELNDGGWQFAATNPGINQSNSWEHGVVSKTLTKSTINGTQAWATSLTGTFSSKERSALYSPSFDLSNLTRPMVSFDKFVQFNRNEGVIIQYSVDFKNVADSTKVWHVLGEAIGEGVEWFTDQGIASKPGDQLTNDFAWSGADIKTWRESKHTLSNVLGKPPIEGVSRIVFRFALGARQLAVTNEGFAMDNFRIGERTRIILHESFANTGNSSPIESSENAFIKSFKTVGTDVIRINYHTGFPGTDPFNLDNPTDNSSRALFYNVSSTPDSYLDGEYGGSQLIKQKFSAWGESTFGKQTLSLANAKIDINKTVDTDGVKVDINVTAIDKTIPKDSVALFVAILEEAIPWSSLSTSQKTKVITNETEFNYVLKKMLPTASGTIVKSDILTGNTATFGLLANGNADPDFVWKPDPTKFYLPNTGDLAIVAFLQNVITKKIYQSSIVMDLNDPIINVVTGLEAILPEQVNVYPNPASKEFKVELPAYVKSEVRLHLIDQVGRKYERGVIPSGSNSATVNVENLSEGIYILEIGSGDAGIIRRKIMVVMNN